jgi:hypothetical protein
MKKYILYLFLIIISSCSRTINEYRYYGLNRNVSFYVNYRFYYRLDSKNISDSLPKSIDYYYFSEKGLIDSAVYNRPINNEIEKEISIRNKYGKLIGKDCYLNNKLSNKIIIEKKRKMIIGSDTLGRYISIDKLNRKGLIIKSINYSGSDTTIFLIEYSKNNLIKRQIVNSTYSNNEVTAFYYTEFDKYGNWIKRYTSNSDSTFISYTKRIINYSR